MLAINKELRDEQNRLGSDDPDPDRPWLAPEPLDDSGMVADCIDRRQKELDAYNFDPGIFPGYRINFILMGDLLDLTMHYVNSINPKAMGLTPCVDGTNVRLGTSYIDYTNFEGKATRINIADIPVSLEQFVIFWRDKVIKRGRTSYKALDLIKKYSQ